MNKLLRFGKEFSVKGTVCEVSGRIDVIINGKFGTISQYNAVTHDDYERVVYYHEVCAYIDDILWRKHEKIDSKDRVLAIVKELVADLKKEMIDKSHRVPPKNFEHKLNEILNS